MIKKAADRKENTKDAFYYMLENELHLASSRGQYYLYGEPYSELAITINSRPDKTEIFQTLIDKGYKIIETHGSGIKISWE